MTTAQLQQRSNVLIQRLEDMRGYEQYEFEMSEALEELASVELELDELDRTQNAREDAEIERLEVEQDWCEE